MKDSDLVRLLPASEVLPLHSVHADLSGELRPSYSALYGAVLGGQKALQPHHATVRILLMISQCIGY